MKVAKVNIDENPEIAAQYGVRSIPTLAMFKAGEVADIKVGAAPKTALSSLDFQRSRLSTDSGMTIEKARETGLFC